MAKHPAHPTPAPTPAPAEKPKRAQPPFAVRLNDRADRMIVLAGKIGLAFKRAQLNTESIDSVIAALPSVKSLAATLPADFKAHRLASAFGPTLLKGNKVQIRDTRKASYAIIGDAVNAVFTVDMVGGGRAQIVGANTAGAQVALIVPVRDIKTEGTVEEPKKAKTAEEKAASKAKREARLAKKAAAAASAGKNGAVQTL